MLRFLTAGESHGKGLTGILEGFPKGLKIDKDLINRELTRRQQGYGRGGRMLIEKDTIDIFSGLRNSITLGSPIGFIIKNKDSRIFPFSKDRLPPVLIPRPGHADLAGVLKYSETKDIRNILERASARETAARVAAGAFCKQLLETFNIKVISYVSEIGGIKSADSDNCRYIAKKIKLSSLGLLDKQAEKAILKKIDSARQRGDTLGGVISVVVNNVPAGLGSVMHWDRRLDARLFYALASIPAVKGVEIGLGFEYSRQFGSKSHDPIYYSDKKGYFHKTNNSGGIEGGMTTGEPVILRIAMKPISTLLQPLDSVNIKTKKKTQAHIERSDVVAVTACGVVAEAMTAYTLASAFLEKYPGDNILHIKKLFSLRT